MLLLIDNYDSFVHNLARYFRRLGQETCVVRNDATSPAEIRKTAPAAIVLSPGPCTPDEAGCSLEVVRELAGEFPMLGVCLGHQTIAAALGGDVVRAVEPMHGRTSRIAHDGHPLFSEMPTPLTVCRYHSLVVRRDTMPSTVKTIAYASDGAVMAIAHAELPLFGVQFHPEAILTSHGFRLLANFMTLAGLQWDADIGKLEGDENRSPPPQPVPLPAGTVTF